MRKRLTFAGIGLGALVYANTAYGLKFTFNPIAGTPQEVITGFTLAGQRWSNNLTDNTTIKITIQFTALADNHLGETDTFSQQRTPTYTDMLGKLTTSATSADDLSAVAHLQPPGPLQLLLNRTANSPNGSGSATPFLDADGDSNNTTLRITSANAKALGYFTPPNITDATITFNSSMAWDYDPGNGISAGKFDLIGIATHEIGHVLGILSGVDVLDGTKNSPVNDNLLTYVSTMDLFRFSTQSIGHGNGVIDWTADTRDKYFSVDGGATKLASFAKGVNFGDGMQASHWKDNLGLGIFDPSGFPGELLTISDYDLRLLDVIGWERNNSGLWAAAKSGKWSDALNWNTASVPTPAIAVTFNAGAASTYTVNFTAPAQAQVLRVGNNAVTFQLAGQTLTVGAEAVIAGTAGDIASLTLAGAGVVSVQSVSVGGSATTAGGTGALAVNSGATLNVGNTLKIWNTPGSAMTITGGSVSAGSIDNGGNFDFASGNLTISGDFVHSGASARFAGQQNWAANSRLLVNAGAVRLLSDAGQPGQTGTLSIDIRPSAQISFEASQHIKALSIAGGNATLTTGGQKVLVLSDLSIDALSTLDLNNNELVFEVNNGDPAAALAQITQFIRSARNANPVLWTGPGLTSSTARDNSMTGLAIALNDRGGGTLLDPAWGPDTILVKYTWNGDVNLDGALNLNDYFVIDSGYLAQGGQYANGDINYDGAVNLNDYFLIDSAYLGQTGILGNPTAMVLMELPDPAGGALLLAAGLLLPRRRRRA